MALSADRNTPMMDAEIIGVPLAANKKAYAGGIACADASGYATPGATATTLTYLGRFEETVDNTGGSNGDKTVRIRRGKAFKFKNKSDDLVTQAELGKTVYVVDDETVAKTSGTNTRSAAGKCLGVESDGVWVE